MKTNEQNINQMEVIEQMMEIIKYIKPVKDYFVYNSELIVLFIDEICLYDFDIIAHHLNIEMPLSIYLSDVSEMRMILGGNNRTMILPLNKEFSKEINTL